MSGKIRKISTILLLAFCIQLVPTIQIFAEEKGYGYTKTIIDEISGEEIEIVDEEAFAEYEKQTAQEALEDQGNEETLDLSTNEILFEVEEKRTESEKHFRLKDGSFIVAQYPSVVHYEDEQGAFQEIDNTLVAESKNTDKADDFNGYVNKENAFKVKFAENSSDKLFSLSEDKYLISLGTYGLAFGQAEAEITNNIKIDEFSNEESKSEIETNNDQILEVENKAAKAEYTNIINDVDFKYTLLPTGVKEDIVINSKKSVYQYSFELELENLTPRENEDGSISLMSIPEEATEGEEIEESVVKYNIPAPFMYDVNERYSDVVSYMLTPMGDGKYVLKVVADKDWINDEITEFPVTIDPIIEKVYDTTAYIDDTFVGSGMSNPVYGNGTLQVGFESASEGICYSYIKFALPTLQNSDVVVSSVMAYPQYQMNYGYSTEYGYSHVGTSSLYINAQMITTAWNQSNTVWLNRPSRTGIILDSVPVSASTAGTYVSWDITKAVKAWYSGTSPNRGIALSAYEQNPGTYHAIARFVANNYPVSFNKPSLYIQYRNNKGLEGYWSYSSASAGNAGTAQINDYSGNLVFVRNDYTSPSDLMPLSISHVYNAYLAGNMFSKLPGKANTGDYSGMYMGLGWKLNIQETIVPVPTNLGVTAEYKYIYTDGDGTEHYFLLENGKIVDEDGLGLTLTTTSTTFKLTDKDGNYKTFKKIGADGFITESSDAYNNKITYTYASAASSRIIKVTDPSGTYVNLNYDAANYLSSIVTSTGRTIRYYYESPGNLIEITDTGLDPNQATAKKAATYSYKRVDYDTEGYPFFLAYANAYEDNIKTKGLYFDYEVYAKGMDINGNSLNYSSKRISEVKWTPTEQSYLSNYSSASYTYPGQNITKIQYWGHDKVKNSSDDLFSTCIFDNLGRAVSAYTEDINKNIEYGNSSATYTDDENVTSFGKNKLANSASLGITAQNMVQNGGAEFDSTHWNVNNPNNSRKSRASGTTGKYSGNYAYYFTRTNTDASSFNGLYQLITLSPGTYTFSARIRLSSVTAPRVLMVLEPSAGYQTIAYKEGSSDNTMDIDNGWELVTTTFTLTQTKSLALYVGYGNATTGTCYIDNIQLEKDSGYGSSEYNMLDNCGFEYYNNGVTSWTKSYDSSVVTLSGNPRIGSRTMMLPGIRSGSNSNQYFEQRIYASNYEDVSYVLSGWAKAEALSAYSNAKFELFAEVKYKTKVNGVSTSKTKDFSFPFAWECSDWQYISGVIVLPPLEDNEVFESITSINVGGRYSNQENTAYFDNLCLVQTSAGSYSYDDNGNPKANSSKGYGASKSTFNNANDLITYVNAEGNTYNYTYNNQHDITQATSPTGIKYNIGYNSKGQATSSKIESSSSKTINTSASYLSNTKTEYTIDNQGAWTSFEYDSKLRNTMIQDSKGNQTRYLYKPNGMLERVYADANKNDSFNTGEANILYTYDNKNYLTNITTNTSTYNLLYNTVGVHYKTTVGTTSPFTLSTDTYNSDHTLLTRTMYGTGQYKDFIYDKLDNLTEVKLNNSSAFKWGYNANGQIVNHTDLLNNLKYDVYYDAIGRNIGLNLAKENSYNLKTWVKYNTTGQITNTTQKVNNSSLNYTYTYDTENRLKTMKTPLANNVINYTYDSLGRLTHSQISDKTLFYYQYKDTNAYTNGTTSLIEQMHYRFNGGTTSVLNYTYDANSNITSEIGTSPQFSQYNNTYVYDNMNQLTRHITPDYISFYTYDKSGNILTNRTLDDLTYEYTRDDVYTYGNSQWGDLLTAFNGTSITYDQIGNPLSYYNGNSYAFEWQNGRELKSASVGTTNVQYMYNADSIRTQKNVNGVITEYILDSGRVIATKRGVDYTYFIYDTNGRPIGMHCTTSTGGAISTNAYFFVSNPQGDILKVVDYLGNDIVTYEYDPWGKVINEEIAPGKQLIAERNIFRYRGYIYDSETELYYLQSRYYDPHIGRFINADGLVSTGQGVLGNNMFVYCGNNPVCRADYSGYGWSPTLSAGGIGLDGNPLGPAGPIELGTSKPPAPAPIASYPTDSGYTVNIYDPDDEEDIPTPPTNGNGNNIVNAIDHRNNSDNPNIQVKYSYMIKSKEAKYEVIDILINYNETFPTDPAWVRTRDSMKVEWDMHNYVNDMAYTVYPCDATGFSPKIMGRTMHVDFDNNDENTKWYGYLLK